jgi:hypothetical protein
MPAANSPAPFLLHSITNISERSAFDIGISSIEVPELPMTLFVNVAVRYGPLTGLVVDAIVGPTYGSSL